MPSSHHQYLKTKFSRLTDKSEMDGKKSVLKVTPSTDLKSLTGSWLEVNNNAKVRKPFTIEDCHFSGSSFDDRTSSTN